MPAARLSAICCSSSWNLYGGMASRRLEGSAMPMGAGIYAIELIRRVSDALVAVQRGERLDQLRRELAGEDGLGPAVEPNREILGDLDLQLAPFELDHERARSAAEEGGDGGTAGAGAGGERLPHPALEDPRPHPVAVDREEADVGAVGEELVAFDPRPDLAEGEVVELLVGDDDRALRVADRDMLELPLPTGRFERAATVLRPRGEVLGGG